MAASKKRNPDFLWWKHGVIYQIYPRSFSDASGDGTGDLRGIIDRLDYLSWLGIDGIWLSPINTSPMFDFGYDVSDYRGIDPVFGSQKDFDVLIKEAHRRGIRIIMDLVLNHTSHLHPWFVESRSSRDNPKRDWYIWRDARNGGPPNNWMAAFGGRAWEWDEKTKQYYLHLFLKEQPDVNWRNESLKKAMFADIKYWLDRGVDGFRLDVINYIIKDARFRSNPFHIGRYPRPYDLQLHVYDRNQPESHEILREFRKLLNRYPERMAVGEVFNEEADLPALSAEYMGGGDELHTAFNFEFILKKWNAASFLDGIRRWDAAVPGKGWPCHVYSNHDQPRSISRYGGRDAEKKARVLAVLLLTLRGTPFIYYGEEIGMRNGRLKRGEMRDPLGLRYWPINVGRDGERTPMQWSADTNAGFTTGKPWLPVNGDYREVNVEAEKGDPDSLLSWYRALLQLRRDRRALHAGAWKEARGGKDIIAYYRELDGEKLFVAVNFSRRSRSIAEAEAGEWKVLMSTHRTSGEMLPSSSCELAPYEALIMEKTGKMAM